MIGADVFLRDGFHATGLVDFTRARITGNLQIIGATLADGLDLESARIGEGFFWRDLRDACPGIDLTEASCGVLHDERAAWARTKVMRLSGFTYDRLQSDMGLGERLDWLGRKADRALPPEFAANLRAQPGWARTAALLTRSPIPIWPACWTRRATAAGPPGFWKGANTWSGWRRSAAPWAGWMAHGGPRSRPCPPWESAASMRCSGRFSAMATPRRAPCFGSWRSCSGPRSSMARPTGPGRWRRIRMSC